MDLYKIQKKVSKRLPIKKFTHTLGVQTTCFSQRFYMARIIIRPYMQDYFMI